MKKKIFLYLGNHSGPGITDYINSLRILCKKKNYLLTESDSLTVFFTKNFDAIIFIENFANFADIAFLKLLPKSKNFFKILILTEFINKKNHTFNNFENLNLEEENVKIKKEVNFNFLIQKYLKFLLPFIFIIFKHKKLIVDFLRDFVFLIICSFLIFLFPFNKKKYFIIKRLLFNYLKKQQLKAKFNLKKRNFLRSEKLNIYIDEYNEYVFMKRRYENFLLIKNEFDFIFRSHPGIELDNIVLDFYFYYPDNLKLFIDQKEKIKLIFSGFLTSYRIKELEKLLENKNNFFDYSYIEKILQSKRPRFVSKKVGTNICSLHLKKTKNWPYSSPTRYVNSLEKNEIPIVIDDFNDDNIKMLYLGKNFLNCENYIEVNKYLDKFKLNLKKYKNYSYLFEQNFDELFKK